MAAANPTRRPRVHLLATLALASSLAGFPARVAGDTSWYPYDADAWSTSAGESSHPICAMGRMQSPIDLPKCKTAEERPAIQLGWGSSSFELFNNHHTVQLSVVGIGGKMIVAGAVYTLVQCHWHWGSEHTVGGQQMNLAAHCVHTKDGQVGRYGVLGVLYDVGDTADPFVALIEDEVPSGTARRLSGAEVVSSFTGPLDLDLIHSGLDLRQYWTYNGSFTTPPCTEAVDWYPLMNTAMVTQAQLDKLTAAMGWGEAGGNYRPPQPLFGRDVLGCEDAEWYPYKAIVWAEQVGSRSAAACASGEMQSPIDLPACSLKRQREPIELRWGTQAVVLTNNGHTVQLEVNSSSATMTVQGTVYTLLQCHWHWGSEHTVGGVQSPLAGHCVHKKAGSERYGVLGIFYEVGATANAFLRGFEDQLPAAPAGRRLEGASTSDFHGPLHFDRLAAGISLAEYWTYHGSLTTPPCSELVDWFPLMGKATLTQAQLHKFRASIGWDVAGGNYRPPQPLHGRLVEGCYVPTSGEAETEWYPYSASAWSYDVGSDSHPVCATGKMQSPIDLPVCKVKDVGRPAISLAWGSKDVVLLNNDHTVQATILGPGGKMSVGGATYTHVQCHWHWGSEHTVGGQQLPLAAHCVHVRDGQAGRYGVLGVLYEVGPGADPFIALLQDHLPSGKHRRLAANTSGFSGPLDFDLIHSGLDLSQYWTYNGSFTTPPCTEAVDWYPLMNTATVTQAQLDSMMAAMGWRQAGGNYRPPQPLSGRDVWGCVEAEWYPYKASVWAHQVGSSSGETCASGEMQSPIDLPKCSGKELQVRAPIQVAWGTLAVILTNNGHTVQLTVSGSGAKLAVGGHSYTLVQCHWHWGSEHTVGGVQYPLAVHCVHTKDASDRYGVLGIFYDLGSVPSDFLDSFADHLPAPAGRRLEAAAAESTFHGPLNFDDLPANISTARYWTYRGSLTTPPCSELVDWYPLMERLTVTQAQLNKFKDAIGWTVAGGNYRPPQPLNGREVEGCGSAPWYPYTDGSWAAQVPGADAICKEGHFQSPVDLPLCSTALSRPAIGIKWGTKSVKLVNNGHSVQMSIVGAGGRMTVGGVSYTHVQCHWHWGSEHTVEGQQQVMAVHCVHTKDAYRGKYGVVGILYTIGKAANAFLSTFEDQLPMPTVEESSRRLAESTTTSGFVGPAVLDSIYNGLNLAEYWSYDGSFTTPPCTEVVDWFVLMGRASITASQLDKFKAAIGWSVAGGNFRPPQPLSGREVLGCSNQPWYPYSAAAWARDVSGASPLCAAGRLQSPVDLPECELRDSREAIAVAYGMQAVELLNDGHAVQLAVQGPRGQMAVAGNNYSLVECRFHWGSEHTVGGEQQAMSVNCLHQEVGRSGRYGVLAILYEVGNASNLFLTSFEDYLPANPSSGSGGDLTASSSGNSVPIDFDKLYGSLSLEEYWTYDGSLTSPPCSEGVEWYVLMGKAPMTMSQLDKFKAAIGVTGGNFRPPQPLNGRSVRGCNVFELSVGAGERPSPTVAVAALSALAAVASGLLGLHGC